MNLISPFEAHKRDEEMDAADAKSAHVSHADRVKFADAMMRAPEPEDVEDAPLDACVLCGHAEPTKDLLTGNGGVRWHDACAKDV